MTAGDEVLLDGEVVEDAPSFQHLSDAAAHRLVRRQTVEPRAVELDAALGDLAALGAQQARNRLQRRRLAGAVGAEQRRHRRLLGDERDTLQHQDDAVIDDLDVVERQHSFTRTKEIRPAPISAGRKRAIPVYSTALSSFASTSG